MVSPEGFLGSPFNVTFLGYHVKFNYSFAVLIAEQNVI